MTPEEIYQATVIPIFPAGLHGFDILNFDGRAQIVSVLGGPAPDTITLRYEFVSRWARPSWRGGSQLYPKTYRTGDVQPVAGQWFSDIIANLAGDALPPAAIPTTAKRLAHDLSQGVSIILYLDLGIVSATPAPVISLPKDAPLSLKNAAKDAALLAAIASLIGSTGAQIDAAMADIKTGTAIYNFMPDVTGMYIFTSDALGSGFAGLLANFTLRDGLWGGTTPPATLACTTAPAGSAVTSATLVSYTRRGPVLVAWDSALASSGWTGWTA